MNIFYIIFFVAIVHAEINEKDNEKRDLFLQPIRQTVVRPAMMNTVVQPVIHDVVQPVITQKVFKNIVNPVQMTHQIATPVLGNTLFTNRFVKRSADKEEAKENEKRDLLLSPIRQTVVRPAMMNTVVQPVIHDVVQPVITQKVFKNIVNPVQMTHHIASPVLGNTLFTNRFVKRSADKEEAKENEKRDLFLSPIRQTVVRPAMMNTVVQPVIHDVVQPVITQKVFKNIVNPVQLTHQIATPVLGNTLFTNRFVKRSADKEEAKETEKRDLFLSPITQTVVRPAMMNTVVHGVVQPVITQKVLSTFVNPVRVLGTPLVNTFDMGMRLI